MNNLLIGICSLLTLGFLLDAAAALLDVRALRPQPPPEFAERCTAGEYSRTQRYIRQRTRFALLRDGLFLLLTLAFLWGGGFNLVDRLAYAPDLNPVASGLLFIGLLALLAAALQLPFSLYATFVLEARFGCNTTTLSTFALDQLKTIVLAVALGGPLLAAVLWLFITGGAKAWLFVWLAVILFMLVLQLLAPTCILPLFNRFTPLPDGALRQAIESYVQRQNFAIAGIYSMDGSRRSTRANAFFTGFGRTKRIVFFDTLLSQLPQGEILAVLAHEMGHYKLAHVPLMLAAATGQSGLLLFFCSLCIDNSVLFAAFGVEHISVPAALAFFAVLASPIATVLAIPMHALSRRYEYQADRFALASGIRAADLIGALKRLSVKNLAHLTPHPLSVGLHYSHPPTLARIHALQRLAAAEQRSA